jgi:hypothetical protein
MKQGPKWGRFMKKKTEFENLVQVYLEVEVNKLHIIIVFFLGFQKHFLFLLIILLRWDTKLISSLIGMVDLNYDTY